jgi:uncharacterized protein
MQTIKPLTRKNRAALVAFMDRADHPEGTLSYGELEGFLFTVAAGPRLVPPSEWLPRIFAEHEPPFRSSRAAEAIMGSILALFNASALGASEGNARLPADCAFREDLMANLEPDAPVAQWCRGFRLGHLWQGDDWNELLPGELQDDLARILMTLAFFSSRSVAEAFFEVAAREGVSFEALAEKFRAAFPDALAHYALMGNVLFKAEMGLTPERGRPSVATPHPGRNDPCPCGSGRKHKKCCGRQVH